MTIAEIVRSSGLSAHTIRYYERAAILPPPTRLANGRRDYSPEHAKLIQCVAALRRAGMTMAAMKLFTDDFMRLQRCLMSGELNRLPADISHRWLGIVTAHRDRLEGDLREIEGMLAHARALIEQLT
jgi:DNA-binding transcriptional MerR regulator